MILQAFRLLLTLRENFDYASSHCGLWGWTQFTEGLKESDKSEGHFNVIHEENYDNADNNDAAVTGDDKLSEGHADIRHYGERHPSSRCKLNDVDNDDDDDDDNDVRLMMMLTTIMVMMMIFFPTAAWTWHRLLIENNLFK